MEDNTAEHDGHGGRELADEAEGARRDCDVMARDMVLKGDEWGLEVWAYADAGDHLIDDNFGPFGVVGEVDEESEAEGHEAHAEPDGFLVAADSLDIDAHEDAADG